ncbi:hypothetical protein EZS27_021034 [termite gut metagenome]|uniref:Uncharacterized protein n=1 Tax=termite gut metagenome TaxID=433724 RepID=A0A5J4R919_9ZZZZ
MSETDDKELKLLFIEEELSQHGDWLCEAFTEAIEREKIIRTGDLYDSINYKRFRAGDNPGLRVNFLLYGRLADIAAHRRRHFHKHDVDTNRDVWGMKLNRQEKKNGNAQWYSKNMYGGLNRLVSRVMYGLSDMEIARLKSIIEKRKQQIHG